MLVHLAQAWHTARALLSLSLTYVCMHKSQPCRLDHTGREAKQGRESRLSLPIAPGSTSAMGKEPNLSLGQAASQQPLPQGRRGYSLPMKQTSTQRLRRVV